VGLPEQIWHSGSQFCVLETHSPESQVHVHSWLHSTMLPESLDGGTLPDGALPDGGSLPDDGSLLLDPHGPQHVPVPVSFR
jgi:hypothetical protein